MDYNKVADEVENLIMTWTNLRDDPELICSDERERLLRAFVVAAQGDNPDDSADACPECLRRELEFIQTHIDEVRDWCDMVETALHDVQDALDEEFESVKAGEVD